MYQVLARQYRPRNFNQLVGQNHVSRALTSALERGRLHHAYLFTGTRGVGKTTIARILAKCLNCETGVTATPCEQCATCKAVNDGRFIDLIEIDAASRTKVEDTRELLDNVPYAPTQGRYKVYLIDEVHMLSTHSFNALLKTLEEPPAHVKFLFATTDPQKLPITVISRCLQFTLRPLTLDEIRQHLTQILTTEQIAFEDDALWQISEAAQGSVRDALSLTDQAIAYGQGEIKHQDVKEMLGLIDRQMIYDLILAIHQNQQQQVAQLLLQFRQQALDVSLVLDQLIATLHELAMMQFLPELSLRYSHEINGKIQRLASCVSPQDLQLYYQIACKGRADLQIAVTQEQGFEMTVLRLLAFRPLAVHELPQLSTQSSADATENVEGTANLAQHTQSNDLSSVQLATQVEAESQQILQAVQTSTIQSIEGGEDQHSTLIRKNIHFEPETKTPEIETKTTETLIGETTVELNSPEVSSIALVDPAQVDAMPLELVQDVDLQKLDIQEVALLHVESAQQQSTARVEPVQIDATQTPSLTYFDVQIDQQMQVESGLLPEQAAVNLAQMADQEVFFLNPHQNDGDVSSPHPSQVSQALIVQAEEGIESQDLAKDTAQQHSLNQNSPQQADPTVTPHNKLSPSARQMPQDILRLQPVELEGDWDVHKWEFWFRSSGLSPAVQELAQQGVMHGQINGASVFHISQDYQNLLVTTQQDLQQALTQQWPDTRFSLQYDQLTELSPYQLQKQRKQQAHDCATALLKQEPVIQQLSDVFNATLSDIQLK